METSKRSWIDRLLDGFNPHRVVVRAKEEELVNLRLKVKELEDKIEPYITDNDLDLNNIDPDDLIQDTSFQGACEQIPEGWFAFEMGQSPIHMLWYCQLVLFESLYADPEDPQSTPDPKRVYSEEHNTLKEALLDCINKIEIGEFTTI